MTKVFFTLVPCAQAEWEGEPYRNFWARPFSRKAWEEFFAPERRLSLMLDCLVLLSAERTNPMLDYRLRWSRRSFYSGNIGTIWDRARRRFQLR